MSLKPARHIALFLIAGFLATGLTFSTPLEAQTPAPSEKAPSSPMPVTAQAMEQRTQDAIEVMQERKPAESVFSAGFLAQIPASQLHSLFKQLETQFGPFVALESVQPANNNSARFMLRFEKAMAGGNIALSPHGENLIDGLLINDYQTLNDTPEATLSQLKALPGDVSALYAPLDRWAEPTLSLNPDSELAIGSTSKLYVLAALAQSIANGERHWDDIVRLDHFSLPSGQMQDWPAGTPVTLATLATMMISISDNTATDQLIAVLGRDTIASSVRQSGHAAPDRMLPFLSTLELFALKGDPAMGHAFASANEAEQASQLEALDTRIGGDPSNITPPVFTEPHAIDTIEWFASTQDLRAILAQLQASDDPVIRNILAINPSVTPPVKERWAYVGFKGGSEPGVINLSWLLQDKSGTWRVLIISWNNTKAPLDKDVLELLALRILALPVS